jgi:hypothetical protein
MAHTEPDPFREFSEAFERWRWLLPPIGNLRDSKRLTYPIELDLDHEVSSLSGVGGDALRGNTKPDWQKIAPEYLANLNTIERNVDAAPIPEERKKKYRDYISECRLLWKKISLLPVPAEGHLGFRRCVLDNFSFLEKQYGFRVTETTPIRVCYASTELLVELTHAPGAPELSLGFGRLGKGEDQPPSFSLDDLMYWAGLGLRFDYARFNLESKDGLADFIASAAQILQQYAGPILRNEPSCFHTLLTKQAERERRLSDETESQVH